ncbi:MAG: Gfo/Idh/MocA family oxidoreductase [Bryobacteraceae bacterium]
MLRRRFVAAASMPAFLGANDRVRFGLIGCGGRGKYVAGFAREAANTEIGAVCDIWEERREAAKQWAGPQATVYSDFRKVLEDKSLDAVMVSTPDHWHATIAILAIRAGKDVYVEKPLALTVHEGRQIVEAARKSDRIVQVGTQHRSAPHYAEVQKMVQSGLIGKVNFVHVWNFFDMMPNGIGTAPDGAAVPAGVDWDMYLGPAPARAFNRLRLGPTFRYFWDYSGGAVTDFGIHRFDSVHQIMGSDKPHTISATGGRYALKDSGETPDLMQVTWEYPGWVMSYETCSFNSHGMGGRTPGMKYYNARGTEDRPHGEAFYGTEGTIFTDRIGYEVYPSKSSHAERVSKNSTDATSLHAKNFIESVRTRKAPVVDIETGHRSTLVAHLGNIAMKTGRKLQWDADAERFGKDEDANRYLAREPRKAWSLL